MKRFNNLYEQIYSIENLHLADLKARKGKATQYGVRLHDRNRESNIQEIHLALKNKTFTTSAYKNFKVWDPKERDIFCLPYNPDRIVHHAIMNVLEKMLVATFTADTYSCIKGKGIHACSNAVKRALRDEKATTYCLQIDVRKFYPSIDHEILKQLLRRKIKDRDLLWLLDGIIDSAEGVPIGNYLSQTFANFYLSPFDHWMKEVRRERTHIRYADDMVSFADNKPHLHELLAAMREYLREKLKLEVKDNYQVFPMTEGLDMVGYDHYHTHTLMRSSIKKNLCRAVAKRKNRQTIASYKGWAAHCNSGNLLRKLNLN